MKKLMIALCMLGLLYACTEAGEGSEVTEDSATTTGDTMRQVQPGGSATSNDTSSYERMPNKNSPDSTRD